MAAYEAFDEDVEVYGQTIIHVVEDALGRFSNTYQSRAREALAENGIDDAEPDEWYPQQSWLDTFDSIGGQLEPHLLDRLGEQIPEVADWPDGLSSIEAGLESIDEAYQRNHRGGEIGFYEFERIDSQTAAVTSETPYPCEFDRGLIRAVARRYAPVEAFVFIEEEGSTCRQDGADACTYTVSW